MAGGVQAGGLAQALAGAADVEEVVHDLEGQAKLFAVLAQVFERGPAGAGKEGAAADAGADERAGLGAVDGLDLLRGNFPAHGLQVGHLAGEHPAAGAGGGGKLLDDLRAPAGVGEAQAGEEFEGQRQQGVAGQEGDGLAELLVAGGLAAAQVVVVERGQVVVDERVGVDELQGAGQVVDAPKLRSLLAQGGGGFEAKDGTEALAAGEDGVAHGAVEGAGLGLGGGQEARQVVVETGAVLFQTRLQVHRG